MRFHSELEVTGDPAAIELLLSRLDAALSHGWQRATCHESAAQSHDSVVRCYSCTKGPRRAEAVVYLAAKAPDRLQLLRIEPLEKERLSYEEHNALAKEFYTRFIEPAAQQAGVDHKLLEADIEIRQYGMLGPSARPERSASSPTKPSASLAAAMHPMDEERLLKGLASVSEAGSQPDVALNQLLRQFQKAALSEQMKELLYSLAQKYESSNNLVDAGKVYQHLYETDSNFKNVKEKAQTLASSVAATQAEEKTAVARQLGEKASRRYELLEELGRGAMGIVYKAQDNELDEIVALKILPENLSRCPEALQRFRVEARAARKLTHPNIVRIHDIGEDAGRRYISMEYVDGGDLKKLLADSGVLSPQELVQIMNQVCSALDYAHSVGIVHRDIKPANLLISRDLVVKVSDFGIAKILQSTADTVTAKGTIIGTPLYMSPEQLQGQPVDNRADIYSLGIMMYELVNGDVPFRLGDIAYQHVHVAPEPLPHIPPALNEIILKCLAKRREDRWARASLIAKALEQLDLF